MARPQKITDEEILAAARRCFLEHGPQAPTDAIAQELGVSAAALFKRFGTKEELLWKALSPRPPAFIAELAQGPSPELPIEAQLQRIGLNFLEFFEEMIPCMVILHSAVKRRPGLPCVGDVPVPVFVRQQLSTWIENAQALGLLGPGQPTAIAHALIGGAQTRAFLQHLGSIGPDDNEGYIRDLVDVLLRGIAPPEGRHA